ncbi:MAG: DNA helicase [Sulfobacillus benefaciens]|uniref:DNA helicase n=1 Tax=Sulfobacillus benefaciens TaxID=453960 RepID=A0A2T2XHB6_9FIRM|nr:MAG: DNA helicase [Sulfobacillus benefaciens]
MNPLNDEKLITTSVQLRPTISYASYHNHVPVVSSLTIHNHSNEFRTQIQVIFQGPCLLHDFVLRLEGLEPHESRRFDTVDLPLSHQYLSQLGEAEHSHLIVAVTVGGVEVARDSHAIEILAYDQWAGIRELPELLAAFSTPNHPSIDALLSKAGEVLANQGRGGAITGYQTGNREDVWYQISAIYNVIMAEQLVYSAPPASFGTEGQKIRLADRVFSGRVATCLDLTMLFASCLEQAGLHPVALIKKGHSWIGCWLIESALPSALTDDCQSIRKRVQSGEMLVFETTGVANQPPMNLASAVDYGVSHLADEQGFLFAVDIKRARLEQILPLPSRWDPVTTKEPLVDQEPRLEIAPELPPLVDQVDDVNTNPSGLDGSEARLRRWKGKLLDLTARNRLLNFKVTRTVVPLVVPDIGDVEDALADGKGWKFRSIYEFIPEADPRSVAIAAARTGVNHYENLARDVMGHRELISSLSPRDLTTRLVNIFRASRTGFEEGGANTLFLSLGLLYWTDGVRAKTQAAPILLIPVTISRSSTRSGFMVTRHDDDTVVNPTLVQMLRDRFQLTLNGLDPLPRDKHGVDVAKILQIFRAAITPIAHWEVREEVYLGILSYAKYLMWKDLEDRTEDLRASRVVSQLIDATAAMPPIGVAFGERTDIDQRHQPWELLTPLDADSSQMNAISRAAEGYDLVLEGPPGTGKSQTITNLIAHCLGSGRSVLFVSEKMAALEVVYQRLSSVGLAPFCLELHSAKAKKTEVLEQLRSALAVSYAYSEEDWMDHANRLANLRTNLNAWVETLHKRHSNGLTVRDAMGTLSRHPDWEPARMSWSHPEVHSVVDLNVQREVVRAAAAVLDELGSLPEHPLIGLHHSEWTTAWEDRLSDLVANAERTVSNLISVSGKLTNLFSSPQIAMTDQSLRDLDALSEWLLLSELIPAEVMHRLEEHIADELQDWRRHGHRRNEVWGELQPWFRPEISRINGEMLRSQWMLGQGKAMVGRWLAKRKLLNQLRPFMVKGVPEQSLDTVLDSLCRLNEEESYLKAVSDHASRLLGDLYHGSQTDWDRVEHIQNWIDEFKKAAYQWSRSANESESDAVLRSLMGWVRNEGKSGVAAAYFLLNQYRESWNQYRAIRETLVALTQESGQDRLSTDIAAFLATIQRWRSAREQWRVWCRWVELRNQLTELGLSALIGQLEHGKVLASELEERWAYSYQYWWFRAIIDRDPVLRSFSRADQARKIADFQQADDQFRLLTAQYIVAKLTSQVPKGDGLTKFAPEMRILHRELAKKRAHWPVRKLIRELPTLLPKLKPCLLMSPLSVSQYLDASAKFDVVIFDEASQIPVWDAVGAIARGKQLIVVGDPKQLPPTTFFDTQDNDDEQDDNMAQDLESILDECLGTSLPTLRLEWHYRSRYESLIAFSNHRYYGSQLVTFPSPVTRDEAVQLCLVEGTYDRGATRTNAGEANAVVEAIAEHFTEYGDNAPTLGVVTFNLAQQQLIEELLDLKLQDNPELEERISHASERLFVKNLENVQGDERDIIFFSVTYGRDPSGRVALNMGPLNKEGGHRRLNVAITRARLGIKIFSTISAEDIDLSRTRAQGVIDLKEYLHYAQHGWMDRGSLRSRWTAQHPIEESIVAELEKRGWICERQIGSSEHRVDVGVVDPDDPARFVLGIESDGTSYRSLPSVRDRDRLHPYVLKELGWNVERIWSLDWLTNPRREMERIEHRIAELSGATPSESRSPKPPMGGGDSKGMVAHAFPLGNDDRHLGSRASAGKYANLTTWLQHCADKELTINFEDLERIIGGALPPSARKYDAYWYGGQPGSTVGNAIVSAGWRVVGLDKSSGWVRIASNQHNH